MNAQEAIETARAFLLNARLTTAQIDKLDQIGYFTAPAAMTHHLNRPSGLCEHSVNVTRKLLGFEIFKLRESAYRVGMLHDLVKCFNYKRHDHKDGSVSYSWITPPYPGHGVASVMIAADLGIELTPEERAAITWHMGVYKMGEDELKEHHEAVLRWPRQILGTHFCDNYSSVLETLAEMRRPKTAEELAADADGEGGSDAE